MPAHHLKNKNPLVGLSGGVQSVDGVSSNLDSGIEAEGRVGSRQVVVDRLGNTDQSDAFGM